MKNFKESAKIQENARFFYAAILKARISRLTYCQKFAAMNFDQKMNINQKMDLDQKTQNFNKWVVQQVNSFTESQRQLFVSIAKSKLQKKLNEQSQLLNKAKQQLKILQKTSGRQELIQRSQKYQPRPDIKLSFAASQALKRGLHYKFLPSDKKNPGSHEIDCLFCCQTFQPGSQVSMLTCTHFYHTNCIEQWFQQKADCPLCRDNLINGGATDKFFRAENELKDMIQLKQSVFTMQSRVEAEIIEHILSKISEPVNAVKK